MGSNKAWATLLSLAFVVPVLAVASLYLCDWMSNSNELEDKEWAEQQNRIKSTVCVFANILATITNTTDAAQNLPSIQGDQNTDKNGQYC